jgi:hypothetical protein
MPVGTEYRLLRRQYMRCFLTATLLLVSGIAPFATASTLDGTVTGTCGFSQGSRANVVFSEAFSGNGTFCTDFMPGGSFSPDATLEVGDISAAASHSSLAFAPVGFLVFADFDVTFQVTQEYLLQPSVTPSTPTGTVTTFFSQSGTTDDGSGSGSCVTTSGISIGGNDSNVIFSANFSFPVTFGQAFLATETTHISCHMFGPSWGDSGQRTNVAGPLQVFDANGQPLGFATVTAIPEPSSGLLSIAAFGFIALALISVRRRVSEF